MGRKNFISFLGFSNYGECYYTKNDFKSKKVRFVQVAILDYLNGIEKWTNNDYAYILLTEGAENKNWVDDGQVDRISKEVIKQSGLQTCLQEMKLPLNIVPLKNIPDGNNEEEIWTIFERIFEEITDEDELYFDLTHGFRYLPMLTLVLGNYAKFLKKVTIKSITYGNYESRNEDEEAPIIDLTQLSGLQDWTSASASFIEGGNVKRLSKLCKESIRPIMRDDVQRNANPAIKTLNDFIKTLESVVAEIQGCRGVSILESRNIAQLLTLSSQLESTIIPPMNPILNKIKESFSKFYPRSDIRNGYIAAQWCYDNELYQQSITILQENMISHVCEIESIDKKDEYQRNLISSSFMIKHTELPKDKWNDKCAKNSSTVEKFLDNILIDKTYSSFNTLSAIRNDYNHSGMRSNPTTTEKINKILKEQLDFILENVLNIQTNQ